MKVFGQMIATVVIVALSVANLLGLQWLAWHGPQWIMHTVENNRAFADNTIGTHLAVSPLVAVPMVLISCALLLALIPVWHKENK